MSRTPRRDTSREKRRQLVAELYIKGWTQAAIAHQIGTKQPTVSNDLRAIRKMWRRSQVRDFDEAVARELEKIDRVEREAWEAWEKSKQPQESTIVTDGQGGKRAQKRIRNQHGDPRYLEQVSKCISSRRTLLGLDAPTRIAATNPDGTETYHAAVMSELMQLAERIKGGPEIIDTQFIERHLESLETVNKTNGDAEQEDCT